MPENPLLPHAQLRALHDLLKQAAALDHPAARGNEKPRSRQHAPAAMGGGRAALLAGTLLQLSAGDILVPEPGDSASVALVRSRTSTTEEPASVLDLAPESPQLALSAGLAQAFKGRGSDRLVLSLLPADRPEPGWVDALTLAQENQLPLVVACADPSGGDSFRSAPMTALQAKSAALGWSSLQKVANRLKLPVLSVDGEDAVAVYRVMQESVLRSRSGGGPAILWAMLPRPAESTSRRPRTSLPLPRLEHYMRSRGIALSS